MRFSIPTVFLAVACAGYAFAAERADAPAPEAAEQAAEPQPAQPELSADLPIEYDAATGDLVARKNAELLTPDFSIQADKLVYNRKSSSAAAEGDVRLSYRAARALAKRARYDIAQKSLKTDGVRLGLYPLYMRGESVDGDFDALVVKKATLYFTEPDPYGFNVAATSLTVLPDPYRVQLKNATLRVGPLPIFYLPSYTQKLNDRPPVRIKIDGGSRHSLGIYGGLSVEWTKNPEWAPGVMFDYYQRRGIMAGPMFGYNLRKKGFEQNGSFQAGFIHDRGIEEPDALGRPYGENRYYYRWTHKGHLTERVDITNVTNWWSDSRVARDFRKGYWDENQYPDNFTEVVYKGDDFYLDAFARYQPNDFYGVQQRLPALSFDMVPVQIGKTGIYHEAQAGYVHLRQDAFAGTPALAALTSNRYDAYYGLSRPYSPNGWSTITPVLGGRMTYYGSTLDGSDYARFLGQVGFDAEMRMQGVWNAKNETLGIDGLRHVLRPVAQYRYIPSADQGTGRIPAIDRYLFEDFPPMLDLGRMRNLDDMHEINTLRVGVENILQTRSGNGRAARDLAYLNVYQDFNFTKDPVFGTYSDTYFLFGVKPLPWLEFDVFNRFDSEHLTLREIRTRTRIKSGDKWHIDFYTEYSQNDTEQYYIVAGYRLNERWGLYGLWRYDARQSVFSEQAYGVSHKLGNSWRLYYELAFREHTTDYAGFSFNVRVDVLAF